MAPNSDSDYDSDLCQMKDSNGSIWRLVWHSSLDENIEAQKDSLQAKITEFKH